MIYRFAYTIDLGQTWKTRGTWRRNEIDDDLESLQSEIHMFADEIHGDGIDVTHVKATPVDADDGIVGDAIYFDVNTTITVNHREFPIGSAP